MLYETIKTLKSFGFKIKECFILAKEINKTCYDLEEYAKNKYQKKSNLLHKG